MALQLANKTKRRHWTGQWLHTQRRSVTFRLEERGQRVLVFLLFLAWVGPFGDPPWGWVDYYCRMRDAILGCNLGTWPYVDTPS